MTEEIHGKHYHDESARREWQDPEAILTGIGLKEGMTFIDIGCGEGFFTLPAARLVGKKGHLYAFDANPEAAARLHERVTQTGLYQVTVETLRGEEAVLCRECADVVFLGIVLHDFGAPEEVLANAYAMTKPGGKLVNLDWKKEELPLGPPLSIKFSPEKAAEMIQKAGFKVTGTRDSGRYHYIVTGVKD